MASQGDHIRTTCEIHDREAYPENTPGGGGGSQGTVLVSLPEGSDYIAATDELGGEIFVHAMSKAVSVIVPLHQGEWVAL